MKHKIYRYTMVVIGCLITASAINLFYIPNMLLSGGVTGLGFIIYYLSGLPIGVMNLVLNIPLFYLAWKYMDKEYFFGSLATMTFLSFAIDGLHFLTAYTPDVPEKMLSCITGGVMYGLGMGLVYRVGGGTGGMDIIGGIINKYYSISQATTNFIFNIFLMICGTLSSANTTKKLPKALLKSSGAALLTCTAKALTPTSSAKCCLSLPS